MKIDWRTFFTMISLLIILPGFSQVGIGTSEPSDAALLDLSSNSKGLLIPRMTSSERTAIVNPDDGLLVFDLSTQTFWYYRGTQWHELIATNLNNEFRIGDGANYTRFEADGTIEFVGSATVFNDFVVPTNSAKSGGNAPDWQMFRNSGSGSIGVYTWAFDNNGSSSEDELHFTIQMPHDYKLGSAIYPHLHWSPLTNDGGVVTWGMEYTWANYQSTFDITTIVTANSASFSNNQFGHLITELGSISPSSNQDNISSIICIRLFRNSGASADTYTGKAAMLSFDIHYETNTIGSRTEYTK